MPLLGMSDFKLVENESRKPSLKKNQMETKPSFGPNLMLSKRIRLILE